MVLSKVGDRIVDVLVNGSQRASYTQTADRADYDVSVSDNAQTFEQPIMQMQGVSVPAENLALMYWNVLPDQDYKATNWDFQESSFFDEFRFRVEENGGDGSQLSFFAFHDNLSINQTVGSYYDSGWTPAPAAGDEGLYRIDNFSSSSQTVNVRVDARWTVSTGFSIDGVTQS
jgi:hypothetical protein